MGDNFLDDLSKSIDQKLSGVGFADKETTYLSKFAPNAIEFVTSSNYWGATATYDYPVQYQIIRDLFNLRCPNDGCNDQSPSAKLCFGKSRETLQAENLLVWTDADNDFKCPKCGKMAGQEVPRRWWMYLIPWTKNYYCVECYHEFAMIFGHITI